MTATNDNTRTLLTVTDLCARWGLARRVIMEHIHAGRLRAVKFGLRTHRVHVDEAQRFEREGVSDARLSG